MDISESIADTKEDSYLRNSLYSRQDILDMQNAIGLEIRQYLSADYDTCYDQRLSVYL